ncbi:uncharacterized protein [Miscanthus floridulus]|uniref:uncharacterized protein isoform X2 n=1 Tax=Miscanthus floridulus TaxID=154761 RepID=UPI00345B1445
MSASHGGGPPPPPSSAGAGAMPAVRALTLLSPSRADGMARCWREPPRRKLVTFRQGAFEEGNAARDKAVPIPDELLGHCKDANGRALDLEPIGKNSANESLQFSFEEEESDDVVCEISESLVRDVEKAGIELLAARGLLNDGFYAESFSQSRWLSSTWGPRRIKQALRQKGVPEAEVDQATRRVFQDGHGHGKEATFGISEASMDHLFAQASKQWQRGQSLTLENRCAHIVRWLQYRGFNWAVTNSIIRRLEAQRPP